MRVVGGLDTAPSPPYDARIMQGISVRTHNNAGSAALVLFSYYFAVGFPGIA